MITESSLICGDQFRRQAHTICDEIRSKLEGLEYKAVTGTQAWQNNNFNTQNEVWPIFINTNRLSEKISSGELSRCFDGDAAKNVIIVLITHHSDINITNGPASEYIIDLLVKHNGFWLAQNCLIDHPRVFPIPIGIEDPRLANTNDLLNCVYDNICGFGQRISRKEDLIYANFRVHAGRQQCQDALDKSEIDNNYDANKPISIYYKEIACHDFVISPEGAGLDCHRHWEALYLGAIPIVKRSFMTEYFSQYYPMVLIDQWEYLWDTLQKIYDGEISKHNMIQSHNLHNKSLARHSTLGFEHLYFEKLWQSLIDNIRYKAKLLPDLNS